MIKRSRMLLLTAALPFVAGCGVYLHRPELETSTAALKTSFGQLSAPAYLEQQKARLEQFAAREDRTIAEYQVSSRNFSLLNIVAPPAAEASNGSGSARRPADRLRGAIESQLTLSTGTPQLSPILAPAFVNDPAVRATTQGSVGFDDSQLAALLGDYREAGGTLRSLSCVDFADGHLQAPAADSDDAKTTFSMIQTICLHRNQRTSASPACTIGITAGRLHDVCGQLADLARDNNSNALKLRYQAALSALNAVLAQARAARPNSLNALLASAQAARDIVAPEDLKQALEALDRLLDLELADVLGRLSSVRDAAFAMPATQGLLTALHALGALQDVEDAQTRAPLDQPTAILIGIAKVRHDLNIVSLNIEQRQRRIELLEAEATALRAQIHHLARAHLSLCGNARSCNPTSGAQAEALSHLVSSYDSGLIPYEVLRARDLQIRRAFAVRQAQATEADYRALLQPAIDQLAAYGAGGLKPEMLGPFLASLPVTSAILGR